MIRVLTGGYHKEDYEFLKDFLEININDIQNYCIKCGDMCVKCKHRRACLDIMEVIEFLGKGCDK